MITERDRRKAAPIGHSLVFAASLLWSLLAFYHRRYNLVLMAPAVLLVGWPDMRIVGGKGWRRWVQWGLVLFLVLDVPLVLRLSTSLMPGLDAGDLLGAASVPTRLIVLGTFVADRAVHF